MQRIREGDLYKIVEIANHRFEIRYGYYDEKDRISKFNEPMPIFPDFLQNPFYDEDGYMLVTKIQDKCQFFESDKDFDTCYKCKYFREVEDMIGICKCQSRKL